MDWPQCLIFKTETFRTEIFKTDAKRSKKTTKPRPALGAALLFGDLYRSQSESRSDFSCKTSADFAADNLSNHSAKASKPSARATSANFW